MFQTSETILIERGALHGLWNPCLPVSCDLWITGIEWRAGEVKPWLSHETRCCQSDANFLDWIPLFMLYLFTWGSYILLFLEQILKITSGGVIHFKAPMFDRFLCLITAVFYLNSSTHCLHSNGKVQGHYCFWTISFVTSSLLICRRTSPSLIVGANTRVTIEAGINK